MNFFFISKLWILVNFLTQLQLFSPSNATSNIPYRKCKRLWETRLLETIQDTVFPDNKWTQYHFSKLFVRLCLSLARIKIKKWQLATHSDKIVQGQVIKARVPNVSEIRWMWLDFTSWAFAKVIQNDRWVYISCT